MHDKELSMIFKVFKQWRRYVEGLAKLVDIVTNHKNLEYFSTTKLLTRHQAWWSEFLSQFNLIIHFHPRKLSTKLDALTRQWDIYLKEEGNTYEGTNRISDWYSLPHNSWNHSRPHPWSCPHSKQALSWTLKNSSWTSRLTKPFIMRHSNTSMTHQTQDGHSQLMVSSDMTTKFTSQKLETCSLKYYNTSMTTFSLDISVKTKP